MKNHKEVSSNLPHKKYQQNYKNSYNTDQSKLY